MTQRIGIETPHGMVYLGEECEYATDVSGWAYRGVIQSVVNVFGTCVTIRGSNGFYSLDNIRPIPKKTYKTVDMTAREVDDIVNVKRYEWRWEGGDIRIGGNIRIISGGIVQICSSGYRFVPEECQYRTSPESEWQKFEKQVEVTDAG